MNTWIFSLPEFICTTLKDNRVGGFITSRGYRQSKARGPSARRLRNGVLIERITAVHRDNYGVYGVRKMWHALRRDGIDIGREHAARLMRLAGVSGTGKGRLPIIPRKSKCPDLRPDLVGREFTASGPNKLGMGWCYLRAHFRRCRCKLSTRRPKCAEETTGLAHYRRSWLAICQRCLQRAGLRARGCLFHRNCQRLL